MNVNHCQVPMKQVVFGEFWQGKLKQFLKMTIFPNNLNLPEAAPQKKTR